MAGGRFRTDSADGRCEMIAAAVLALAICLWFAACVYLLRSLRAARRERDEAIKAAERNDRVAQDLAAQNVRLANRTKRLGDEAADLRAKVASMRSRLIRAHRLNGGAK